MPGAATDAQRSRLPSPVAVALAGLLALAVAMGVGRFAYTPMLPLMVRDGTLSGVWPHGLAAANYLGYLAGALLVARVPLEATRLLAASLVFIVASTAAMGATHDPWAWAALRGAAGVASAWALVATSTWTLARLAEAGRSQAAGLVYAGVGSGIAAAGLVGLAGAGTSAATLWFALGASASLVIVPVLVVSWRAPLVLRPARTAPSPPAHAASVTAGTTALIACYGLFGFGYILPATFLPLMARELVADPRIFGWAWPLFGLAAALSTLAATSLARRFGRLRLWAAAHATMALGAALPTLWRTLPGIALAALLVGGSFMVVTMFGLQEVRERVANQGLDPTPVLARMTAAFAAGQLAGPLATGLLSAGGDARALDLGLRAAAVVLAASAVYLWTRTHRSRP